MPLLSARSARHLGLFSLALEGLSSTTHNMYPECFAVMSETLGVIFFGFF